MSRRLKLQSSVVRVILSPPRRPFPPLADFFSVLFNITGESCGQGRLRWERAKRVRGSKPAKMSRVMKSTALLFICFLSSLLRVSLWIFLAPLSRRRSLAPSFIVFPLVTLPPPPPPAPPPPLENQLRETILGTRATSLLIKENDDARDEDLSANVASSVRCDELNARYDPLTSFLSILLDVR